MLFDCLKRLRALSPSYGGLFRIYREVPDKINLLMSLSDNIFLKIKGTEESGIVGIVISHLNFLIVLCNFEDTHQKVYQLEIIPGADVWSERGLPLSATSV